MSDHSPTAEQQAIYDLATSSSENILISALAGAAKTSTLVGLAERLPVKTVALAFNTRIAKEMKERFPSHVESMTLNSLGFRTWNANKGFSIVDAKKTYGLVKAVIDRADPSDRKKLYERMQFIMQSIDLGKQSGFIPRQFIEAVPLIDELAFMSILEEEPSELDWETIMHCTTKSVEMALGLNGKPVLDFGDQLLMPTCFPVAFTAPPLVMVDEAQDLSPLNHVMLKKFARRRLIAVGDECQPEGTKISVIRQLGGRWRNRVIEQVPIEQLQIDDVLIGYDTNYSEFMFNRKVEGLSSRPFDGSLINVITPVGTAQYTPNHHCFASFSSLRDRTALYLMQKNGNFRVGIALMSYAASSGPVARARAEDADEMWILDTFETRQEALQAEAAVQAAYGIPDITFKWAGVNTKGYATEKALAEVWTQLANVDFRERAVFLLRAFNRELRYPLWTAEVRNYFSLKRPMIVRACNLLDGCEVLPYRGKKREKLQDWVPCEVRHTPYEGLVWSLTVSHNHLYIADDFVTHNCQSIYGFRGADTESMSTMQRTFNMTPMILSISFRCPTSIRKHAQWRAPHMQSPEWAIPGEVRELPNWTVTDIPDSAVILCRNNAPLFGAAMTLLKNGRRPELIGNDLGKYLVKTLDKMGERTMKKDALLRAIDAWAETKAKKARNKALVADQRDCLLIFANAGATLGAAISYANHIFAAEGPIKLLTIHKSKGLEFDDVFILDEFLIDQDEQQERNLLYVAQTRSKNTLTYIMTFVLSETAQTYIE